MTASTMKIATVTKASDLSAALDAAIAALTRLDADRLEEIEGMVSQSLLQIDPKTLFASGESEGQVALEEIHASHRLLGTLLASTNLNLNILERLHSRNTMGDTSWVR